MNSDLKTPFSSYDDIPCLQDLFHPAHQLPVGFSLGGFEIESVLGYGGFGMTYKAHDQKLKRDVVIKENFPSALAYREEGTGRVVPYADTDPAEYAWAVNNFLREAQILAQLEHPYIVRILSIFEELGTAYFVMPFLDGASLGHLVGRRESKGQGFTQEEVLGLLTRVLSALQYLHRNNLFHRDIKPDNVFVTREGLPILIDFGSARHLDHAKPLTIVVSTGYSPPEQEHSDGQHGPWSDFYSLGALVYRLIARATPKCAAQRKLRDPNPPLADREELRQLYDVEFLKTIDKALSLEIMDRYQTAGAWLHDLKPFLPKQ